MRTDKFKNQMQKNRDLRTSTDEVTDALYNAEERKESTVAVIPAPAVASEVTKNPVGRPKGDETIRKTIYIPLGNWPFVQAAAKMYGGNLQKYFNELVQKDIDINYEKYKDLANLYRSIESNV